MCQSRLAVAVPAVTVEILSLVSYIPLQETMKISDLMQDGNETSALRADKNDYSQFKLGKLN